MPRPLPPRNRQRWGPEGGHSPSQWELAGVLRELGDDCRNQSPGAESLPHHPAGPQRGPSAATCELEALVPRAEPGLTPGHPEAAAVSKPMKSAPSSPHSALLWPQTRVPSQPPPPAGGQQGALRGSAGVHMSYPPELRTWSSFLCRPLPRTRHTGWKQSSDMSPARDQELAPRACVPGPGPSPGPTHSPSTRGRSWERTGEGACLAWKRADFSSDSKEQAHTHRTGHPLGPNPLLGENKAFPSPKLSPWVP